MIDEVKYSTFTESGQKVTSFDLDTFVRLFVNHRPVYGIGKPHIEKAFGAILHGDTKGSLKRDEILTKLQREGEMISVQDLQNFLYLLVGQKDFKMAIETEEINAEQFSQNVLGFEEVEEEDSEIDEEGEGEEGDGRHVAFDIPDN